MVDGRWEVERLELVERDRSFSAYLNRAKTALRNNNDKSQIKAKKWPHTLQTIRNDV